MNKSEIQNLLASYFKGTDADIDVVMVSNIPYLDIQYTDFKPEDVVRTHLLALIPNLQWTRFERRFSKEAIISELWRIYHEDTPMLIKTPCGSFSPTLLSIYVEDRLQTTNFTRKQ